MPEDLNARVERLEEGERRAWAAIEALADKQERLDDVLVLLAEAQAKTEVRFRETDVRFRDIEERFRDTDARFRDVEERFRDVEERFRETDARFRDTDVRIDKLVSAIGELIRGRNGGVQ
ncbi:MAG: hypothetical protein LAP87_10230 [Acidobacteriia bacterium]|nr:hypothetical protein [Terriglobia bacterium]